MVEGCYVKMTQLIFSPSPWYSLGEGGDSSGVGEDVRRDRGREEEWPNICQLVTAVRQQYCAGVAQINGQSRGSRV